MSSPLPAGYGITTPFGKPGSWAAGYHTGDDYAAPTGTPVLATAAGSVVANRWDDSYGWMIELDTGGVRHRYCHLAHQAPGRYGDRIDAGQHIGSVGSTGNSTGPHLHYEERIAPYGYYDHRHPQLNQAGSPPTPPPDQGDDDMTPEQATMLGNINWAVNQIRGTDVPRIREGTDRLSRIHAKVDENHWGIHNDPQGLRHMLADVRRQLDAIAAALDVQLDEASAVDDPPDGG